MFPVAVFGLAGIMVVSTVLVGCGLDGIRGTLIEVDGNHYVLRDSRGHEWHAWADESTQKDRVTSGDEVRVYVAKDRHAAYIQKIEKAQPSDTLRKYD